MGCNLWCFHRVLCSAPHGDCGPLDVLAHRLLDTVWHDLKISEEPPRAQGHGLKQIALQPSALAEGPDPSLAIVLKAPGAGYPECRPGQGQDGQVYNSVGKLTVQGTWRNGLSRQQ